MVLMGGLDGRDGIVHGVGGDQADDAAAEAAAGDPGTVGTGSQQCVHGDVDLRHGDLEVVTQRHV
jgi:hypothetical protein